MQVSDPNNVKIYNLSAGKSLPEVDISTKIFIQSLLIEILFSGYPSENVGLY